MSNRLELDRIQANRAQTAAAIPDIEQQIAVVENELSLLLGRPPGADRTRARLEPMASRCRRRFRPGLPASLLERRPDVVQAEQLLVAANADIGAAKALFFPTISLTGFLGGVSGDLTRFLGGDGRGVVGWRRACCSRSSRRARIRRNLEAAQARFDEALAEYQKAALNGYREVANSLVTIQKLGEVRVAARGRRGGAAGRVRPGALALRLGPRQLHRDPHRRSGVCSSSSCCSRRRAAPSCAPAPSSIGRSAAAGSRNSEGRRWLTKTIRRS